MRLQASISQVCIQWGHREMATVVKIGGARAVDPDRTIADVATRISDGERFVLVHGGSTAVDELLSDLGEEPEYVTTPSGVTGRFTDERTMRVLTMAMAGQVNTDLTVGLQQAGVNAVGLSGVDGGLLRGPRKSAVRVFEDGKKKIRRGDHAGRIETVNTDLLSILLDCGYTPVVSVPMLADDGVAVNADADRSAAAIAGALGSALLLLTDVSGVYADPDDPATRIDVVETPEALDQLHEAAEGFMTRKVMAAAEALERGASEVLIGSANADAPITNAIDGDATRISVHAISEEAR